MSFGGGGSGGGTISGADDVILNNPATGDFFAYDTSSSKWENQPLKGKASLTTGGGIENVAFSSGQSGAVSLDLTQANVFSVGISGNATFAFSGATLNKACSFGLYLYAASGKTVTWPTSVKWANGTAPALTGTGSNPDILVFESLNGGTVWFGSLVGNNFS